MIHQESVRKFMIALNKIDGLYYTIAKKLGIKENAFVLFYALSDGRSHTQKQICEEWCVPRTTINTVTKEYVDKGYVILTPLGNKEKEITLTEEGKEYVEKLLLPVLAAENKAMENTLKIFEEEFVQAVEILAEELDNSISQIKKAEK